jgi:hypothetical protein
VELLLLLHAMNAASAMIFATRLVRSPGRVGQAFVRTMKASSLRAVRAVQD